MEQIMANKRAPNAISRQTNVKKKRRTFRKTFLTELKKISNGEPKLVNSRILRNALDWDEDRYDRVKEQLRDENLIVVGRGGPGGAVAIANWPGTKALSVFISYCHTDEAQKDELIKHLSPLKRLHLISEWHDRKIGAGEDWGETISKNLESASIVLLLVSIDFINSSYCYDIELEKALEQHDGKNCIVIPVILRDCMWQHTPFAKLQALPKDAKPVSAWADRDEAFVNVVQGVKAAAEKLLG
jgi:hypothetical protein